MSKNRLGRTSSPKRDKRPRLSTPSGGRSLLDDKDDKDDKHHDERPPMLSAPPFSRSTSSSTSGAISPPIREHRQTPTGLGFFAQARQSSFMSERSPPSPQGSRIITSPSSSISNLINAHGRPTLPPLNTNKRLSETSTGSREFYTPRSLPSTASSSYGRRETLPAVEHAVPRSGGRMGPTMPPIISPPELYRPSTSLPQYPPSDMIRPPHVEERNIHPHQYPSTMVPPSRPPSQPPMQAWFAIGHTQRPRSFDGWTSDRVEAYHAGFQDALVAMEAGVMGVGGVQYRNPLHVSREIPPDVVPRLSTSRSMYFAEFSEPSRNIQHSAPPYSPHEQNEYAAHPNRPFRENPFQEPAPPPPHSRSQSFSTVQSSSRTGIVHPPPARYDLPSAPSSSSSTHFSTFRVDPSSSGRDAGSEVRHRTRQAISCFPCRKKKLRCDGAKPCVQCVRRNSIEKCAYADGVRRRGKGRRAEDGDGGSSDSGGSGGAGGGGGGGGTGTGETGEKDKSEITDTAEDKVVNSEDNGSVKEEVARG